MYAGFDFSLLIGDRMSNDPSEQKKEKKNYHLPVRGLTNQRRFRLFIHFSIDSLFVQLILNPEYVAKMRTLLENND